MKKKAEYNESAFLHLEEPMSEPVNQKILVDASVELKTKGGVIIPIVSANKGVKRLFVVAVAVSSKFHKDNKENIGEIIEPGDEVFIENWKDQEAMYPFICSFQKLVSLHDSQIVSVKKQPFGVQGKGWNWKQEKTNTNLN